MVCTGTFDDLDFSVKAVKFFCKNLQIFLKKSENFPELFLKNRRKS